MTSPQYKILLIGPPGVGKTHAVRELLSETGTTVPDDPTYGPTLGVDVTPIDLFIDDSPVRFNIWEVGGNFDPDPYSEKIDYIVTMGGEYPQITMAPSIQISDGSELRGALEMIGMNLGTA